MLNNIKLFEECILKKSSYIDPINRKIFGQNVIPMKKNEHNDILFANTKLIEYLTEYNNLNISGDTSQNSKLISLIKKCLQTPGMNLSPFSQYLMVHDLTHDIYINNLTEDEQKYIIDCYLEDRHQMYLNHDYSEIIFQVITDSHSHKRKSKFGIEKIRTIMEKRNFEHYNNAKDKNYYYIFPDKGDSKLFFEILKNENIRFEFASTKQGKMPDALIKIKDKIVIVEHKNIKSTGGGQDKQIAEIIDFIKNGERGIYYVSYLDGVIFNSFDTPSENNKLFRMVENIKGYLEENPYNYFVNTYGFEKLTDYLINN